MQETRRGFEGAVRIVAAGFGLVIAVKLCVGVASAGWRVEGGGCAEC